MMMAIRTLLDNTITENYCVLELRATFIVAGENPQPPAPNDNFVVMVRLVPANLKYFSLSNFYLGSKCLIGTLSPVVVPNDSHSLSKVYSLRVVQVVSVLLQGFFGG